MDKLKLDNDFLEEIGLGSMPEKRKTRFISDLYADLEMRVGKKITEGLSDEIIDEFGAFVDKDTEIMRGWLSRNFPLDIPENRQTLERFYENRASHGQSLDSEAIMSEFGAMMWLARNCPDYRMVVAAVFGEIKKELTERSAAILEKIASEDAARRKLLERADMDGLDELGQAELIFGKLCAFLDNEELLYSSDDEKRTITTAIKFRSTRVPVCFRVIPQSGCLRIVAKVILAIDAAQGSEFLRCINEINQYLSVGCFIFDPERDRLDYVSSAYYRSSLPGNKLFGVMLYSTLRTVDDLYPHFEALNKGEIDTKGLIGLWMNTRED
ncbi:MAG: DUF5663 domain-containing protein [Coriobacteriales bacterium]|nr:DUF5663 domain-containing protein [Coriobacteriales bacterium]